MHCYCCSGTLAVNQTPTVPGSAAAAAQSKKVEQKAIAATPESADDDIMSLIKNGNGDGKEENRKYGAFPLASLNNYSFSECRTLIKTVVCAIKTISWGIASCKVSCAVNIFATPSSSLLLKLNIITLFRVQPPKLPEPLQQPQPTSSSHLKKQKSTSNSCDGD